MENLNKQIDKLNCILHGNGSTYSVYPYDKHSIQEVICEVVTKINEVIDVASEYTAMVKSLLAWIQDEGIATEVKSYLDEMLLDGRLADIINVVLFDEINTKLSELDNKLTLELSELDNKLTLELAKTDLLVKEVINNIGLITSTNLNINFFEGATKEHKLINMLQFACANNFKKVFVPSGTYIFSGVITDTILLPESFNKIVIEGENKNAVIFDYSHLINKAFLKVKGGSGQFSGGYITGVTFKGNETTTGVLIADTCGYEVINCRFENNLVGVDYYNEDGFTEFCVCDDVDFTSNCKIAVRYRKKSENTHVSMHGSGLRKCKINPSETHSPIQILDGVQVYNAPLDFVVWTYTSKPIIINQSDTKSYFVGSIGIETFGGNEFQVVEGNLLNLIGSINSWGDYLKTDKLQLCENVVINRWGGIDSKYERKNLSGSLINGDNNVLKVGADIQLTVYLIGSGYRKAGTYIIGKNPQADELTISALQEHSLFDQNGLGHVELVGSGNSLIFRNPGQSNTTYQMTIRQLI